MPTFERFLASSAIGRPLAAAEAAFRKIITEAFVA